jgi:peptidoglycan/xylan/chitin deacetylase (PgdA/CDA1 family)
MSAFTRAMLPVVALGAGTWFGLGRPDARTAIAASVRAVGTITGAAHLAPPPAVPPLEPEPATVNPGVLADPRPPWPELNPEGTVERAWLLSEGPAHDPDDGRRLVTFTFDDGPSADTAPTLLRILAEHKIRAAFFLIGEYMMGTSKRAAEAREWARRIAQDGHIVGNHTFDHKVLTWVSHPVAAAEIDDCSLAIEQATGARPFVFRPPYGSLDPWLETAVHDRHLELMLWNIDVQDIKRDDPDEIVHSLQGELVYKGGGIVLLHDVHWPSVKAFNRLLRWLEAERWDPQHPHRRGWDIVDLDEYLRVTKQSPQPYSNRDELEKARRAAHDRTKAEL